MDMKTLLTTVIVGTLCQFTAGVSQAQDAGATPPAAVKTTDKAGNVKRGPREVIADKIRTEVAQKLKEAGASCDDLQVTVAVNRDSATPFQVVPSSLSYVYAVGPRDPPEGGDPDAITRHSIALSVFVPESMKYNKSSQFDVALPDGTYHQRISMANDSATYYIGPSWGMRLKGDWAFGASVFVTYATQSLRALFDIDADVSPGSTTSTPGHHFLARNLDASSTSVGAALVLGVQWRPLSHLRLGLTLRPPQVRIWRSTSGSFLSAASEDSNGQPAFADPPVDSTGWLAWASPFSMTLGIAWADPGKWAIAVDGDFTAPMHAGDASNRWYFNGRLGVEAWITPRIIFAFGGFTDVTPLDPFPAVPDGNLFGAARMDFYGGTVALTYQSPYVVTGSAATDRITFSTTLGLKYAYGFGTIVGADLDFAAGDQAYALKRITAHDVSVMIGTSVMF